MTPLREKLVSLKITDIDSDRMMIRVGQGKGNKDRYTLLSPRLLLQLRNYWCEQHPSLWLFPGQKPERPLSRISASKVFHAAKEDAGIRKVGGIHSLHHAFRRAHPLPASQLKIMSAIERCRTPALGGHLEQCDLCGFERPAYNSCRNRHCPKCQGLNKARWLQARQTEVLPVGYFHAVFTLPHELNALILSNKRLLLKILFDAAAQTLLTFGHNNLGGKTGFIAVLHTWAQRLNAHFHLHCLVPAGALSENNDRWLAAC